MPVVASRSIHPGRIHVSPIHVTSPPSSFSSSVESIKLCVEKFSDWHYGSRSSKYFTCAGYEWMVTMYPGGDSKDGNVKVHLYNKSPSKICATVQMLVLKSCGVEYEPKGKARYIMKKSFNHANKSGDSWGWDKFVSRRDIFDKRKNILDSKDTLTLVLHIEPDKDYQFKSKSVDIFAELFNNSTADVAFQVSNIKSQESSPRQRTFYSHKFILKRKAPLLYEMVEEFTKDTPMKIDDVDPEIFHSMLNYLLGTNIFPYYWKEHTKTIMEAAGKYGFSNLRDEAEQKYIENLNLTVANAVTELKYSDAHSLRYVKNFVFDFILVNMKEIKTDPSYTELSESSELKEELVDKLLYHAEPSINENISNKKRKYYGGFIV